MLAERTVSGLHAHILSLLELEGLLERCDSVLDIGCGTGAWLQRLVPMGLSRLVGIDQKLPDPIPGLSLQHFDVDGDSHNVLGEFDLVTCIEVIEHIENVGRLLDLIADTLARDGLAIISTPNVESLRARLRLLLTGKFPSFDDKGDPTHLSPLISSGLEKMLLRRGLTYERIYQYPENTSSTVMFSRPVKYLAMLLRCFLADPRHGDNVIYFIRREAAGA
jgi:2-polyprenyl-3-methyl-5-hydroxy-6-metoxy-1,4-benzoquinol methylase